MIEPARQSFVTPRTVIGVMVVCFGLALTLDNLGLMDADELIRYWPFGLMAVGAVKILYDRARSSRIVGALFVCLGALFAAEEFYLVRIDVWRWWPLVIVFFGVLIISKAFRADTARRRPSVGSASGLGAAPFDASAAARATESPVMLSEFAMWSGIQRRVASSAFKRADLTAIMGGIELDLRQAGTDGEAVVDVFVMWGGVEIVVPPDWAVSNQVTPIMGGAEDSSTGTQQARHRLVVKGVVIMGGIDIKT